MAFRWIHLSDFHFDGTDPYERNTVLNALTDEIRRRREEGFHADALFVTGDIAYSGQTKEYKVASAFFDALLMAAGLDKTRLFIAPGNHDVDKSDADALVRTLKSENESVEYFANRKPKYHFNKFKAFHKWYDRYFKDIRKFPNDNTCLPLQRFETDGHSIAVLAINSALFSLPDGKDHNALWIGRRNLDAAVAELEKAKSDLSFVVMHHPLDWLNDAERSNVKSALQQYADFVLRGHLHQNEADSLVNSQGSSFHIAAGACYQTRDYPNTALFCTVEIETGQLEILPLQYVDSPRPKWVLDTSLFDAPDYIGRFTLSKLKTKQQPIEEIALDATTDKRPPRPDFAAEEIKIGDVDPVLLNMVISILKESEAASRQLAEALRVDFASGDVELETLAKKAVSTPLDILFDLALDCQIRLRAENPLQTKALGVIANFMVAILPAQDSARALQNDISSLQDDPFQLLASHATLAEVRLARRDKRPAQFLFDEKGKPKGKGQLDQGDGWETGRDQNYEQFEKDVTYFLIEQFESYFGEDWKYLNNGKSFRDSFEQSKGVSSERFDQNLSALIQTVLKQKANKTARDIRRNGFNCEGFTFYFLIKASPWITQAEKAKQDVVLHKLTTLFPGIAFLRLSSDHDTQKTAQELAPFLNLHELLNFNQDDR